MSSLPSYPLVSKASQQVFSFQKITRKSEQILSQPVVLDFLLESEIVTVIENAGFDFPNFPETQKKFKVIYFELNQAYHAQAGLIKGLFSLGKPKGVILDEIREKGQFAVKYYESDANTVRSYLDKIFSAVESEIRFKNLLKKVMLNKEKFRNEEALLHKELLAS